MQLQLLARAGIRLKHRLSDDWQRAGKIWTTPECGIACGKRVGIAVCCKTVLQVQCAERDSPRCPELLINDWARNTLRLDVLLVAVLSSLDDVIEEYLWELQQAELLDLIRQPC